MDNHEISLAYTVNTDMTDILANNCALAPILKEYLC